MNFLETILVHSPPLIVAIPLLAAFLTPLIGKLNEKLRNGFVIFCLLVNTSLVFYLASDVLSNGLHTYVFGAKESTLPIVRIFFEVDEIGILMAIISSILSLLVVIYSWSFMKKSTGLGKYYTLILLLTAGMLGMELTGDMFNFFVFLEITSISSCALIAFWTDRGLSIDAAFKYIVISTIGALFVLFAVALLYGQYNALNMAFLAESIPVNFTFIDKIALVVLLAALAMKAGIVPMHMWLPDAYGRAPAAVAVVVVSATLASFYGVLRICFTLYGGIFNSIYVSSQAIGGFIVILAILTMLIGVLMALRQSDFKRLIAFSALAEVGYMFLGVGTRLASATSVTSYTDGSSMVTFPAYSKTALAGSVFHIFNDALDIGLLLLVAGAVYYATKETSMNKLGGLARNMRYTTVFFIIGLLAVSGIPPMNGFASKLIIYESTYQLNPLLSIIAVLSSIMLLAVFVKVFHSVFLGPSQNKFKDTVDVPKSMLISMAVIAGIIVFIGLFPNIVFNNLISPAVDALVNNSEYISSVLGGGV
ncbi:MAG: proton-conducting transporter membrane subunit [Candidatus Thermoplasmatota archaeon]